MKISLIISIASLIYLVGCLPYHEKYVPKPVLAEKSDILIATNEVEKIEYESFWEAARNLDPDYARMLAENSEEIAFAENMRKLTEGDVRGASEGFLVLFQTARDPIVKRRAGAIRLKTLFFLSEWDSLQVFAREPELQAVQNVRRASGKADFVDFLAAFAGKPDESYTFSRSIDTIDIETGASGSPTVKLVIESDTMMFWVDTGANLSIVGKRAAEKLGINPIGDTLGFATTPTGNIVEIRPAIVNEIRLGALTIENHPVMIIDETDLVYRIDEGFKRIWIDGVLGWKALQNLDLTIDFLNQKMIARKPKPREISEKNLIWLDFPIARMQTELGRYVNFGLDTGSEYSIITKNIEKKASLKFYKTEKQKLFTPGGITDVKSDIYVDLILRLSGYDLRFRQVGSGPTLEDFYAELDGVLASDFAKFGSLRIDFLNNSLEYKYLGD